MFINRDVLNECLLNYPLAYCALRFFLQWHGKEEKLYDKIKSETPPEPCIRDSLKHFQISRNFKGIGTDPGLITLIRGLLVRNRDVPDRSPDQRVEALAHDFQDNFEQYNLSAASKLLWLSTRDTIIYDGRAVETLLNIFSQCFRRGAYNEYTKAWREVYKILEPSIRNAVIQLPKAKLFIPGSFPTSDEYLSQMVNERWFRERVFDIFLWENGEDS